MTKKLVKVKITVLLANKVLVLSFLVLTTTVTRSEELPVQSKLCFKIEPICRCYVGLKTQVPGRVWNKRRKGQTTYGPAEEDTGQHRAVILKIITDLLKSMGFPLICFDKFRHAMEERMMKTFLCGKNYANVENNRLCLESSRVGSSEFSRITWWRRDAEAIQKWRWHKNDTAMTQQQCDNNVTSNRQRNKENTKSTLNQHVNETMTPKRIKIQRKMRSSIVCVCLCRRLYQIIWALILLSIE